MRVLAYVTEKHHSSSSPIPARKGGGKFYKNKYFAYASINQRQHAGAGIKDSYEYTVEKNAAFSLLKGTSILLQEEQYFQERKLNTKVLLVFLSLKEYFLKIFLP